MKDLNSEECLKMLRDNYIGRLAYVQGKNPYVIPITYYYYNHTNKSLISYSGEGHKIDSMRKNKLVSLEVDKIDSINKWKSVLVHGEFEEVSGIYAKKLLHEFAIGVKDLINSKKENEVESIKEFSNKLNPEGKPPIVYRIKIHLITGKQGT